MMSKLPKILLGIFAVALALLVAMQVYIAFFAARQYSGYAGERFNKADKFH